MSHLATSTLFCALFLGGAVAAQLPVTMSVESRLPSYRTGQTSFIDIQGTPGRTAMLMWSAVPRETVLPSIGTFCFNPFAYSTTFASAGTIPATGKIELCDGLPCNIFIRSTRVYVQALEGTAATGLSGRSNCDNFLVISGPCFGGYTDLTRMGLHAKFTGITKTQSDLTIEHFVQPDKKETFSKLSLKIDWSKPPALPITVNRGTIVLTHLEKEGQDVIVQFSVLPPFGQRLLDPATTPCVILDGTERLQEINVEGPKPLDIGTVIGPYTVIDLVGLQR